MTYWQTIIAVIVSLILLSVPVIEGILTDIDNEKERKRND